MNNSSNKNYYEEKRDELIEKFKNAIDQCLKIIGDNIDDKISDDKLHNVLKGKRLASEDVSYYLEQLKKLENEKNGVKEEEQTKSKEPVNWAKQNAKRPN